MWQTDPFRVLYGVFCRAPLTTSEITVNFPWWKMSEQERGTCLSSQWLYPGQVQVNKVGYIFLVLHIFLDVCKNSNKQPGHAYCKSQHLRLRWGKEISTGKRHEQNLSKYFKTVYLYKPKSSGKWQETSWTQKDYATLLAWSTWASTSSCPIAALSFIAKRPAIAPRLCVHMPHILRFWWDFLICPVLPSVMK